MNLTQLLQAVPAKVRAWLYVVLGVALTVQQFFGWPGGRIGEGIVQLAAAAGLVLAVGNVDRS